MNGKYFFCYDKKLSSWLRFEKGYKFITHAIHPKTRQDFYLYESSNQLFIDVEEYKTNNK